MTPPTKDLCWPSDSKEFRASSSTYRVEQGKLVVTKRGEEKSYALGDDEATIASIVDKLTTLLPVRKSLTEGSYNSNLFRYLTAMMGKVNTYLQKGSGRAVSQLIKDYKSREENGFLHDNAGRAAWKSYQENQNQTEAFSFSLASLNPADEQGTELQLFSLPNLEVDNLLNQYRRGPDLAPSSPFATPPVRPDGPRQRSQSVDDNGNQGVSPSTESPIKKVSSCFGALDLLPNSTTELEQTTTLETHSSSATEEIQQSGSLVRCNKRPQWERQTPFDDIHSQDSGLTVASDGVLEPGLGPPRSLSAAPEQGTDGNAKKPIRKRGRPSKTDTEVTDHSPRRLRRRQEGPEQVASIIVGEDGKAISDGENEDNGPGARQGRSLISSSSESNQKEDDGATITPKSLSQRLWHLLKQLKRQSPTQEEETALAKEIRLILQYAEIPQNASYVKKALSKIKKEGNGLFRRVSGLSTKELKAWEKLRVQHAVLHDRE